MPLSVSKPADRISDGERLDIRARRVIRQDALGTHTADFNVVLL